MKIKAYREHFITTLSPTYDVMEAESFFALVLEDFKSWKRVDLALNPEAQFSAEEILKWNGVLEKLQQEIPIQYILGKSHFYGMEFYVNQNVLIPRPETEELVQWILSDTQLQKIPSPQILDIGTGSGCIAITLAKNLPHATVNALDVSVKALEIAALNAKSNGVAVNFIQADILQIETLDQSYDIIVSNPPYVRMLEKNEIRKNVLEHEPHLALFVEDDDALIFYRTISLLAKSSLRKGGKLYFEINQYLADETFDLLTLMAFVDIKLQKDMYGNHRMISASL